MNQSTGTDGMPASFQPGFRFSGSDVVMLLAAGAFGWWIYERGPWLAKVTAFVVGNYFLFCNVFRVSRSLELAWSVVFVVLAGVRLRTGTIEWSTIYWLTGALTVLLVVIEMRKPSYHGVGWRTINPGLKEWWIGEHTIGSVPEAQPRKAGD